ncbi:MAG: hypothetical protein K6T16_03165 [Candidatus Pacearchaeota archaeon]|nr:hypothetical protein [Candidatus Pacearchaeota archaeon]
MNEKKNIKLLYGGKEYRMNRQQLDRAVALATKRLNYSSLNGQLGLGTFSVLSGVEKEAVKVFIEGHESELYREMNPELVFAIEYGLMDDYELVKEQAKEIGKEKHEIVNRYIPKAMTLPMIKIYPPNLSGAGPRRSARENLS